MTDDNAQSMGEYEEAWAGPPDSDASDCYFCGTPTTTWAEERDDNVGYRGRMYYCAECEWKVYE